MCGISGIISRAGKPIDRADLKRMNDLIAHRGPDAEGYYYHSNFVFGHRRLSILDLSESGNQPMHFKDKYTISYNGEIYNFVELKEELVKKGYLFVTETDTEVILAAYDFWGKDCVKKFNGMWAFALFDRQKQIIFCSRDRFGIKPFYYYFDNDFFSFGSEIKQLLIFQKQAKVDVDILVEYLVTGIQEYDERTFFQGIFKLMPSHSLFYDLQTHNFNIDRYYFIKISHDISDLDEEKSVDVYFREFERSIRYRLRSDVKVGTCLSGGLDSSSVAAVASGLYNKKTSEKFNAVTAKSIDPAFDETDYAEKVVNHSNLEWNVVAPEFEDFVSAIDDVITVQEEPFGGTSIFMQYFVMKKASEIGCTVMLDGQGGDETLLGYEKYYPAVYKQYFHEFGLLKMLNEIRKSNKNNSRMSLNRILFYTLGIFFPGLRRRVHLWQCRFLKKKYQYEFPILKIISRNWFKIDDLQKLEIEKTNLPTLLKCEDRNSMRFSVEARLPFLDFRTLETALSINFKNKIYAGWTKYILRRAMEKNLPSEVLWRKNKFGFDAPEKMWLKQFEPEMISEITSSGLLNDLVNMDRLKSMFPSLGNRLQWRLYNIARWEKVYHVCK